jgi:hypothetical protein
LLGILDTSASPPVLQALTTPIIIDGVAIQNFDGLWQFYPHRFSQYQRLAQSRTDDI